MNEFISGNIFIRTMGDAPDGLRPGEVIAGHTHGYDHTSIFFFGRWQIRRWRPTVNGAGERVMLNGIEAWHETDNFERDGPFHLLIEAGNRHEFTFLGNVPFPNWLAAMLPIDRVDEAREQWNKMHGRAWCIYSHRTPQGEVSIDYTGWDGAYR